MTLLATSKDLKKIGKLYVDDPNYTETFLKLLKKWEKYCQDELSNKNSGKLNIKRKKLCRIAEMLINSMNWN